MKFNYEFEFDVDDFADWFEEDFFDMIDDGEGIFTEERNKEWIADKLYDWCSDTSCPSILIISQDIEDNTKKYFPQIVDEAYEILKKKYEEMRDAEKNKEKEEIMEHLRIIADYCEKQSECYKCPIKEICDEGSIGDWRIK